MFLIDPYKFASDSNPYPAGVNFSDSQNVVANAFSMAFIGDGTKVYCGSGNSTMYLYELTTGWDLATSDGGTIDSGGLNTIRSMNFTNGGLRVYQSEASGDDGVKEYTLTSPYDYDSRTGVKNFNIQPDVGTAHSDIFFKPDGTKFYVISPSTDKIHQYDMSTPWDLDTASYDAVTYTTGITSPQALAFTPDGLKLFIIDHGSDLIRMYDLSTAWDLSTVSSEVSNFDYTGQESEARVIRFGENGRKMYIMGSSGTDAVHEYTLNPAYTI